MNTTDTEPPRCFHGQAGDCADCDAEVKATIDRIEAGANRRDMSRYELAIAKLKAELERR